MGAILSTLIALNHTGLIIPANLEYNFQLIWSGKMSTPQIGLLEGIPDEDPRNSSNLPVIKIELENFLYTMVLATNLEGSQKILTSPRPI